jgi:hypothetical protein
MLSRTYYSPYPTMADLEAPVVPRGWTLDGLGQEESLAEKLRKGPKLSLQERARLVGYKIPKPPIEWESFKVFWNTLVSIDIMALELEVAYNALAWQLARGFVDCEQLQIYNDAALDHYRAQELILQLLRLEPSNLVPGTAPFPKLFIGRAEYQGSKIGEIVCQTAKVSAQNVEPQAGCPVVGTGVQGVVVPLAIFAIGAGVVAVWGWALGEDAKADRRAVEAEELVRRSEIQSAYASQRNKMLVDCAEECRAGDPRSTFADCMKVCDRGLTEPGDVIPKSKDELRKEKGLGLLAWLGVGVLVAGAGYGGYRLYKARRG